MDLGLFWMWLQIVGLLIRPLSSVLEPWPSGRKFCGGQTCKVDGSTLAQWSWCWPWKSVSGILSVGLSKLTVGRERWCMYGWVQLLRLDCSSQALKSKGLDSSLFLPVWSVPAHHAPLGDWGLSDNLLVNLLLTKDPGAGTTWNLELVGALCQC